MTDKSTYSVTFVFVFIAFHCVFCALFNVFCAKKDLAVLQRNGYKVKGYFAWLFKRVKRRFLKRAVCSLFVFALCFCAALFTAKLTFSPFLTDGVYVILCGLTLLFKSKEKAKTPFVFTARGKRLFAAFTVLLLIFSFALAAFSLLFKGVKNINYLSFSVAFPSIMFAITPLLIALASLILSPFEKANNKRYVEKAKRKLIAQPNLIRIAITGSYGKTTIKEMLATILSEKFSVLATPASFNTPLGIAKTVEKLSDETQIFIAEAGARRKGDIKELCEIIDPDIAVITGIASQHIETFGSLDEIKNTKAELLESKNVRAAYFPADDKDALSLKTRVFKDVKTYVAGFDKEEKPYLTAENFTLNGQGSAFTLVFGSEKAQVFTSLLGKHNVADILLASAVALGLGLKLGEVAAGIARIKPVKHRLEVVRNDNILIIDDAYNSNEKGVKTALEVLKSFDGRKVLVTPGIVEAGKKTYEINFALGLAAAAVCDIIVLEESDGKTALYEGLIKGGKKEKDIVFVKNSFAASEYLKGVLKSGDKVLFENDLGDEYT
ncbi:MAG TPA: hypothetical protein DDY77_05160 [Clostridiales bacterium]|nr:hypothetical protein [Clostridiales bacterium]